MALTHPPTTLLSLGDIGIFEGGSFRRLHDLSTLEAGVEYHLSQDGPVQDYFFQSSPDIRIQYHAERIVIEFDGPQGLVFQACKARIDSIAQEQALSELILALYRKAEWDADWCLVTEVMIAESCTLLVSGIGPARIELRVNADLGGRIPALTDTEAHFSIAAQENMNTVLLAQPHLTPLFRTRKVHAPFLLTDDRNETVTFETYIPG